MNDPHVRNWILTTMGRHFAGTSKTSPIDGICPICGNKGKIATRRRNAAYVDDASNWLTSCELCFEEDLTQLNDLWADYYATRF